MMKFETLKEYRRILAECFVSDNALLNQWHVRSGRGLEACVERTFEDLKGADVTFFKVTEGTNLVGYFAKETPSRHDFLTGFFIKPEFRTKEAKAEFWNLVRSQMSARFYCGLYTKNLPANKFIKSSGGSVIHVFTHTDGEAVFYQLGA